MSAGVSTGRPRLALLLATSGHSGLDRVAANLLSEAERWPVDIDVLTIGDHGPYLGKLPSNARQVPLRARHRTTALGPLLWYLLRERPRTILTAGHRLNRTVLLARKIARVDCRVVIRMGMSLRAKYSGGTDRTIRSMRFWYPRADAVVVPSAGVGADLEELAGVAAHRLHVIPNPIVNAAVAEQAAEAVAEPWLNDGGGPVIMGAGALEPRKDFATLVAAFARLRQAGSRARLLIAGEGPERARLEAQVQRQGLESAVKLVGHVCNPYAYMVRSAVFVLSSQREGSGAVLVEAMACGTPVVATDCPSGPSETLQQGRLGPLVPVGDSEALANAIWTVLREPPPPELLREGAAAFDAEQSAQRYLEATGVTLADDIA